MLRGLKSVGLLVLISSVTWVASDSVGAKFAVLVTAAIWIAIATSGHVPAELARRVAKTSGASKHREGLCAVTFVASAAAAVAVVVAFLLPFPLDFSTIVLFGAFTAFQALQNSMADIVRLVTGSPKSALFSGWAAPYASAAAIIAFAQFQAPHLDVILVLVTLIACLGSVAPLVRLRAIGHAGDRHLAADALSYGWSLRRNAGLTLMSAAIPAAPMLVGDLDAKGVEQYALAQRLIAPVSMPAWALASASLPQIASAAAESRQKELRTLIIKNAAVGGVAAAIVAGGIWLLTPELLYILGGQRGGSAAGALGGLMVGAIGYATAYSAFQFAYQVPSLRRDITLLVIAAFGLAMVSLQVISSSAVAALTVSVAQVAVLLCVIWLTRQATRAEAL